MLILFIIVCTYITLILFTDRMKTQLNKYKGSWKAHEAAGATFADDFIDVCTKLSKIREVDKSCFGRSNLPKPCISCYIKLHISEVFLDAP